MKDWLARHDPDSPFLHVGERVYSYGETLEHIEARSVDGVEVLRPSLDFESVVDLLAVMSVGTAVAFPTKAAWDFEFRRDFTDIASVIYTSGSSGLPKGVLLTRDNWAAAASASVEHIGHDSDDIWLLAMSLSHVAGLSIILRSAFVGGSVLMLPEFDAISYAVALRKVTMASMVPTMLHRVLDADSSPYEGLRAVLVGGGRIPAGLLERAAEAGLPVLPTYGMTETCGQVATLIPGSELGYKAHPLPGVEFRLGKEGRIELRGPMVSPGYVAGELRSPEDWFVTGDAGSIDSDGAIRVSGRLDEMIITGGENVSPRIVEDVLRGQEGIDDVVVVGIPSVEWGMEVGCVYAGTLSVEGVRQIAHDSLQPQERPRRWLKVDQVPSIGPGKPDRSEVGRLLEEGAG